MLTGYFLFVLQSIFVKITVSIPNDRCCIIQVLGRPAVHNRGRAKGAYRDKTRGISRNRGGIISVDFYLVTSTKAINNF